MRIEHTVDLHDPQTFTAGGEPVELRDLQLCISQSLDGGTLFRVSLAATIDLAGLRAVRAAGLYELGADEELVELAGDQPARLALWLDEATRALIAPAYSEHNEPIRLLATEVDGVRPARELACWVLETLRRVTVYHA